MIEALEQRKQNQNGCKHLLLECLKTDTECSIDIDTQCWKKAQQDDRD